MQLIKKNHLLRIMKLKDKIIFDYFLFESDYEIQLLKEFRCSVCPTCGPKLTCLRDFFGILPSEWTKLLIAINVTIPVEKLLQSIASDS